MSCSDAFIFLPVQTGTLAVALLAQSICYWDYKRLMFYVYVLQSQKDQQLYVGYTTNLNQRIATHNKGSVPSTKSRRPWKFIFAEIYTNQTDALRREKYFKTTIGKRALKMMLKETLRTYL